MSDHQWLWCCDRSIPSKTGAGSVLRDEVLEHLQEAGWGKHDIFSIHLALEEALVNAIKHGNKMDLSKTVHVECRLAEDRVDIEITDEGEGFNVSALPDPTDAEHRLAPNGRGVLLMRSFMDRVEFNDRGNHVLLHKQRTDPPKS